MAQPFGLLIGGTSHVGKTTLATRLGRDLGWMIVSTDGIARHPGRPWPEVRAHVAEYYEKMSPDTLHWFLKVHHRNMWLLLQRRIARAITEKSPFILEGSAVRPELWIEAQVADVDCVFLVADAAFIRTRIHRESKYDQLPASRQQHVDAFLERSLRDNDAVRGTAKAHGLPMIDASDQPALDRFVTEFSARLRC